VVLGIPGHLNALEGWFQQGSKSALEHVPGAGLEERMIGEVEASWAVAGYQDAQGGLVCVIVYSCPASGALGKTCQNKSAFEATVNQYRNGLAATCPPFNIASLTTFGRSVLGSKALQSLKKQNELIMADLTSSPYI
jgi:hypothetical protein